MEIVRDEAIDELGDAPAPAADGVTQPDRSLSDGSAFATLTAYPQKERKA